MDKILFEQLPELFESVAAVFADKRDELCDMDAKMGDGDLGLTMDKGYGALPDLIRENAEPGDIGKTLMKAGMKMSSVVPSTMGTLMSSGVMEVLPQVSRSAASVRWAIGPFWMQWMLLLKKRWKRQRRRTLI